MWHDRHFHEGQNRAAEAVILTHFFLGQNPLGFHKIAYSLWPSDAETQPPLVCVHGLIRNGRDFDRLAANLAADRRVFCPDIAGRGRSDNLPDPNFYAYPHYCADMVALIARIDAPQIDWLGTSMGGLIGMMLAAQSNTPIRRLIINDIGPLIPEIALKRITAYVAAPPVCDTAEQLEDKLRKIYKSFGITRDADWRDFAAHSQRALPDGRLTMAYDPAIAVNFGKIDGNVDLWSLYDRIRCPTLVLRGAESDVLPADVAIEMTKRGPCAQLVEWPHVGHAPALLDLTQIQVVRDFLSGPASLARMR